MCLSQILLDFLFGVSNFFRHCRGVCLYLGSLYIRLDALFQYLVIYLHLTLGNLFFNHDTFVPIHLPIHLAFVHICFVRFLIRHALLSETTLTYLLLLFLPIFINYFHALGHHVLAGAKGGNVFSRCVYLCVNLLPNSCPFLGRCLVVVTENFIEVSHHTNHNIVESTSIDEICGFDVLRSENVWTYRHCDVIVSHLVVRFLLYHCPAGINDEL